MKYFVLFLLITAGLTVYLNRAYAHIFSFLNANNPGSPLTHMSIVIPPSTATSSSRLTYVSLGDSLTAGAGAATESESYPYRLAKLLAEKHGAEVTLDNLGQPGANTIDVLNQQVPLVAALHPDVVTLLIGVNDLHYQVPPESFEKNLAAIVDNLSSTTEHLNIITIPYLGNSSAFMPPYQTYYDLQTKRFNNLLREALSGKKVSIIDLYSLTREQAFSDNGYYSPDGFHPSAKTYTFWSKIIYDHLDY